MGRFVSSEGGSTGPWIGGLGLGSGSSGQVLLADLVGFLSEGLKAVLWHLLGHAEEEASPSFMQAVPLGHVPHLEITNSKTFPSVSCACKKL